MSFISFAPVELLGWAIGQPWVAVALGAVAALGIGVLRPGSSTRPDSEFDHRVRARYAPECRAIGWTALATVIIVITEHFVRSYASNLNDVVSWWRFATPVFIAGSGLGALLAAISTTGSKPPEHPVLGTARRTSLTFTPRPAVIGSSIVCLVLIATTVIAGLHSSADQRGRHVLLEIPIPNEPTIDPVRIWFFGWAYGLPVLIALVMLAAFTALSLHANAVRPFIRPETVAREQVARRQISTGAVQLATAAMLLALGDAWQFIASSGGTTRLSVDGSGSSSDYEVVWRGAEIATALGWLAPVLEISAFAILFLAMRQLRQEPAADRAADDVTRVAA